MTIALPSASEIAAALIAREELPPEKGDLGPQGKAGEDGGFGPPGPQGPKGDPGRDGVDGAPGDLGPVGPQGKQGDRGLKGDKGDKGDEGEKGDRGPIGPTGASGSGRSFFPRGGGGSSSGSGLPSGGTVGQVVTNTAPGTGTWQNSAGGASSPLTLTSGAPTEVPLTLVPDAGQTEALLILENASAGEAIEAFANGSINQYLTDPAVIGWLIKMASGQTASPLRVVDEFDRIIFDFDPVNGNIFIKTTGPTPDGSVQSAWYAQNFANYAESDLLMSVGHGKFELDTFLDYNTPANSYTHFDLVSQPSQAAGEPMKRFYNYDLAKYVHRILISGAISTSGTVPADGDILTGETFFWFDPTNGAASPMWKGKSANGTVVSGSLGGASFATPAVVLGTAAAAGAASTVIRSDSTIVAFDATTPAAVGTAAVGAAAVASRRDHVHATGAGTPSTQAFGDAAATGTGPAAAMTDHKHAMPAAPATVVASADLLYLIANYR